MMRTVEEQVELDIQASGLYEVARQVCPRCARGEAYVFDGTTHTHFDGECEAAHIYAAVAEMFDPEGSAEQ